MKTYTFIAMLICLIALPTFAHGETVVTNLEKEWKINFSHAVDVTSVHENSVYIVDKYDEKIAVDYVVNGKELRVIPQESYINYWSYTLVVTDEVHSAKGRPLTKGQSVAFTTQSAIEDMTKITSVSEADYQNQALVTLSYDDGYSSWYTKSLPLHSYYNIPATYNIIGEKIYEGDPHYMTSGEIWVASDLGIEIASHTFTHPFLTSVPAEQIHEELVQTNEWLIDLVGKVDTLAIPYSAYSLEIRDIAKEYYKGIRVFDSETNRPDNYDPYWLKSFAIVNTMEFDTIKSWIDRAVEERSWVIIMLHGISEDRLEEYETTPEILQDILQYINSYSRDELLPVTTVEGLTLTEQWLQ